MSTVGNAVVKLREQKKISQNKLAKMAGISQSALSSIENETKSPSVDTVVLLAKALGVNVSLLLGQNSGDDKEKPTPMSDRDRLASEVTEKLMQLRSEKQNEALSYIEYLLKTDRPDEGSHQ